MGSSGSLPASGGPDQTNRTQQSFAELTLDMATPDDTGVNDQLGYGAPRRVSHAGASNAKTPKSITPCWPSVDDSRNSSFPGNARWVVASQCHEYLSVSTALVRGLLVGDV